MAKAHRTIPYLTRQDIERFWSHVAVAGNDDCWKWTGATFRRGYGQFQLKGQPYRTPRIAYVLHYGDQPGAALVCHHCDEPACCNPAHLYLGSPADNSRDMVGRNRQNTPSGKRHGSRTKPESRARGERVSSAKLTASDVIAIRQLYADTRMSHREIAEHYGVTREAISRIIQGRNWKHLD